MRKLIFKQQETDFFGADFLKTGLLEGYGEMRFPIDHQLMRSSHPGELFSSHLHRAESTAFLVGREKSLQQRVNGIVFTDGGKVVDSFSGADWALAALSSELGRRNHGQSANRYFFVNGGPNMAVAKGNLNMSN